MGVRVMREKALFLRWILRLPAVPRPEVLQALTKCGSEAPIALAMGRMWDAYSACVAREVGDESDWLDWYCWENAMGAKGLTVTSTSGKTIKVRTVAHLARVICY